MTIAEWLEKVKTSRELLKSLLEDYHPVKRQPGRLNRGIPEDHITAPNAEAACVQVRKNIRQNFEGDPVKLFDEALENDDWHTIHKLLNDAWFGVPESRNCWRIPGFREAVDLMDDLPEE